MSAAALSGLTITPRPRRVLAAARRGDRARGDEAPQPSHVQAGRLTGSPTNRASLTADGPQRAAPAASIAVTVHIDLHGGAIPPAVAGLIDSLRGLAGSAAITVAPSIDPGAASADPGAASTDLGARSAGAGARLAGPDAVASQRADDPDAGSAVVIPGGWRAADPGAAARTEPAGYADEPAFADEPAYADEPARVDEADYVDGAGHVDETGRGNRAGRAAPVGGAGWGAAGGPAVWTGPRPVPGGGEPGQAGSPLRIYLDSRVVLRAGVPVRLTRREYDLLAFLCQHPRRVFSRAQLLHQVWGYEMVSGARTVDVHVRRLRAKLGERGPLIATVRGVGYRLDHAAQVTVVAAA